MPGKKVRRDLVRAKKFVEEHFGRGSSSAKVTFNLKTYTRAMANQARTRHGKKPDFSPYAFLVKGGQTPLGTKGGNQLVFLHLSDGKRPSVIAHELTHSAYSRMRLRKDKRVYMLVTEALGYSMELEFIAQNWKEYENSRGSFANHLTAYKNSHETMLVSSAYYDYRGRYKNPNHLKIAAEAIAFAIHDRFPSNPNSRKRLRLSLAERGFTKFTQVNNFIKNFK